jgi:hypothetical protein
VKVIGLSLDAVENAVVYVGERLYGGNLRVQTSRDRSKNGVERCTFTLGVVDTSANGMGARCSTDLLARGNGPLGRARSLTACWHAHFDVIECLLLSRASGLVTVQTAKATYNSDNFLDVAYATAFENVGTAAHPVMAFQLCTCGPDYWPFDESSPGVPYRDGELV